MWTKALIALLWLGFVASWVRVAQHTTFHELLDSLRLLLLMTLAYALVLIAWVLHNLSIHRRKGPRTKVREAKILPAHDYLGVPVEVSVDRLSESEIIVDLVEGKKYYLPGRVV